ncbi:MAG: ISNCY family transposase [Planctomycetota bacterium]
MTEKDMITMSRKESRRLHIIHQVLDEKITQVDAASVVGLTDRQIRRLIKRVREEGDGGICHRSRGKTSNHRIPKKIKDKALKLYRERYSDFGPTLASEKLLESHQIALSDETLRLWLNQEDVAYRKRKKRVHRQWRERKKHFGEMVQMDGSHHDWFEGRGPKCVLMGYIDDATGNAYGRFYGYEGTLPAMDSFKRYAQRYGIPGTVYLDRHSTYKSTAKQTVEEELTDKKPQSQFERALSELGIKVIHAHSPQAKGRIERLFRTLQDRLVKEMRLAGIHTVEQANEFLKRWLPVYNRKFRVGAVGEADLHRPALPARELDKILCIKEDRTVRNDFTIAHNGKLYQIEDRVKVKKVMVEERIDGSLHITTQGQALRYREITVRPVKQESKPRVSIQKKRGWTPPPDHPWRRPIQRQPRTKEQLLLTG